MTETHKTSPADDVTKKPAAPRKKRVKKTDALSMEASTTEEKVVAVPAAPVVHAAPVAPKVPVRPLSKAAAALDADLPGEDFWNAAEAKEDEGGALPERMPELKAGEPMYEGRYYYGLGRRKKSIAQVRLFTKGKDKGIFINGLDYKAYLKTARLIREVEKPFMIMKALGKFGVKARANGGGIAGQAQAVRLGISRALVLFNGDFRKRLRRRDLLTRDARMVERKKPGLRKARRAPQWSKR